MQKVQFIFKIPTFMNKMQFGVQESQEDRISLKKDRNIDRSFKCPCGKGYASYAAVYTHIRNKHQRDKDYIRNILRPNWENNRKGRPKRNDKGFKSKQLQEMFILEMALLSFQQQLGKVYPVSTGKKIKIILNGNQNYEFEEVLHEYTTINKGQFQIDYDMFQEQSQSPIFSKLKKFFLQFTKHLQSQISARVMWTLNKCLGQCSNDKIHSSNILQIGKTEAGPQPIRKMWFGSSEPAQIIINTFNEYLIINSPEQNNEKIVDEIFGQTIIASQ